MSVPSSALALALMLLSTIVSSRASPLLILRMREAFLADAVRSCTTSPASWTVVVAVLATTSTVVATATPVDLRVAKNPLSVYIFTSIFLFRLGCLT